MELFGFQYRDVAFQNIGVRNNDHDELLILNTLSTIGCIRMPHV